MGETGGIAEKKKEDETEIIDDEGFLKRIEPEGAMGWIVTGIAVAFSLFHLYTSYFGVLPALRQRSVHLTFVLVLLFLLFPTARGRLRPKLYFMDIFFALISIVVGFISSLSINISRAVRVCRTPLTSGSGSLRRC